MTILIPMLWEKPGTGTKARITRNYPLPTIPSPMSYTGGKANGKHYYYWINDNDNLRYVVLSYGEKHILLTSGDPSTMSDYVSDNYYYFTKEEDN